MKAATKAINEDNIEGLKTALGNIEQIDGVWFIFLEFFSHL